MTLPALIQNYQKMVLKNQFKKTYSMFYSAVKNAQANLGYPVQCFYWDTTPYEKVICTEREPVYNGCLNYTMPDGSPMPSNYNGQMEKPDCFAFEEELFDNVLKTVKFCEKNALSNGCITKEYRGTDKIKEEQNPDAEFPPNPDANFSENNIKNKYSSWVLADGTIFIKFGKYKSNVTPIYTVDINGHKGPNKWGYDIFSFQLLGDSPNGITKINGISYATEKNGLNTLQMIQQMYK